MAFALRPSLLASTAKGFAASLQNARSSIESGSCCAPVRQHGAVTLAGLNRLTSWVCAAWVGFGVGAGRAGWRGGASRPAGWLGLGL